MRIGILGAGAMGCLYGAFLSRNDDSEVFLVDVRKDHIDLINREGLKVEEDGEEKTYTRLRGCTDARDVGECDLVLVFVKSTVTERAIQGALDLFGPDTVAMTLQNGLGNLEIIQAAVGRERVIGGTTAHGATMIRAGRIRHGGNGITVIGEPDGKRTSRIENIRTLFENAGLDTEISSNVIGLIWDKLLVNVGINGLTAITGIENGKLLNHPEMVDIMNRCVKEAAEVAKAMGIDLGYEDPAAHTREVARATGENRSSMLQDMAGGNVTEIDMINGAIVKAGERLGIDTPYNSTVTALIKCLEREKMRER